MLKPEGGSSFSLDSTVLGGRSEYVWQAGMQLFHLQEPNYTADHSLLLCQAGGRHAFCIII